MRAVLIVLILMTAPSGALAEHTDRQPPAKHLRPYDRGTLYVHEVPDDEIWKRCYDLFTEHNRLELRNRMNSPDEQSGCAIGHDSPFGPKYSWCKIVVGFDDPETFNHELAHCNGWPADHPAF